MVDAAGRDSDDNRLAELASGFAIGELTDQELRELYDRIRAPGESGDRATRAVWETLSEIVDLRATVSRQFQDALRHRIEHGDRDQDGFLRLLAGRLGMRRPPLQEVSPPDVLLPHRRSRLPIVMLIVLALIVLIAIGLQRLKTSVRVLHCSGDVTAQGEIVQPGRDTLHDSLTLGPHSQLTLRWPNGETLRAFGPASLVPRANGLSLTSGLVHLQATAGFAAGLPDMRVELQDDSLLAVAVREARGVVGVRTGRARIVLANAGPPTALSAGQTASATEPPAAWLSLPKPESWEHLALPSNPYTMEISGTVAWSGTDGALTIHARTSREAEEGKVVIQPGAVLLQTARSKQTFELAGARLLARPFTLRQHVGGRPVLRIEGHTGEIVLPFPRGTGALSRTGTCVVEFVYRTTGPCRPEDVEPAHF